MKKSSHSFLKLALVAMAAFTFFCTSCEIGMGESVDLEAPVISVKKMVSGVGGVRLLRPVLKQVFIVVRK